MNALPQITPAQAQLPRTYEAAREALATCQNIDECQSWTDKAAALASYAKQAEDDGLMKMATRIKARATRRAGELLRQIDAQGRRSDLVGATIQSRTEAAREAGMSKHQQVQAVRIASVPEEEFDAQVESNAPPTLSQLAQQGVKKRPLVDLGERSPKDFNRAMHFVGAFEHAARELGREDIESGIAALEPGDRDRLRRAISRIDAITDQIITRI